MTCAQQQMVPRSRDAVRRPACGVALQVAVDNFAPLSDAYGADATVAIWAALEQRLAEVIAGLGLAAELRAEPPLFHIGLLLPQPAPVDIAAVVDAALIALGSRPIEVAGDLVMAAVSARIDPTTAADLPVASLPIDERLRDDMAVAAATFLAIAEGRLYFLFQSIAGAADAEQALYQECFARLVDGATEHELHTPRGFMPALERLGLTRRFDRAVVEGGLEYLRANPVARVGCNISSLSAVADAWWTPVLDRLAAAPDLAERLVIEITETAPRGDIEPILGFVRAFRRAGCRIAIDNFGAGFSGLRFAVAAAPDIIKIDACYVREQAAHAFGPAYLGHLVGLARCLATEVVVVGIENDSDLSRARMAAADWVQGRHVAPASLFRTAVSRLVSVFTDVPPERRRAEVIFHRPASGSADGAAAPN
ncbi:EAL domain-containing protein [Sphingoaurantiacus capsulatus]|uniref:EAL domain-containing protein n=1 Tax=Sphingoaurantiacus capsulatus TaxID=1771310 RepID=A0ABV7XEB7_9SPHN